MPSEIPSQGQIDDLADELMSHVPLVAAIGNVTLRAQLGWTEEQYWRVRNRIIEHGRLVTGRGRGGSVRRASVEEQPDAPDGQQADEGSTGMAGAERDLYGPMLEVIRGPWAKDKLLDAAFIAEITAAQGKRPTGGKWTRPDITAASSKVFTYLPKRDFNVITFEVKPVVAADVSVVYEALGHRRAATKSYALIHAADDLRGQYEEVIGEICSEAKTHGIGVIVAGDAARYETWEEMVEAVRYEPDPERMNGFLAQQVSDLFKEQVIKWCK